MELRLCFTLDRNGRTIWIVDAHGYGKSFIVRAGEKVTAFEELQRPIHEYGVDRQQPA